MAPVFPCCQRLNLLLIEDMVLMSRAIGHSPRVTSVVTVHLKGSAKLKTASHKATTSHPRGGREVLVARAVAGEEAWRT